MITKNKDQNETLFENINKILDQIPTKQDKIIVYLSGHDKHVHLKKDFVNIFSIIIFITKTIRQHID